MLAHRPLTAVGLDARSESAFAVWTLSRTLIRARRVYQLPTKRLQKTESLSWSYYEPLLRGLLDEHAVDFQAEDEETARAAQWASHQRIGKIEKLLATAVSLPLPTRLSSFTTEILTGSDARPRPINLSSPSSMSRSSSSAKKRSSPCRVGGTCMRCKKLSTTSTIATGSVKSASPKAETVKR